MALRMLRRTGTSSGRALRPVRSIMSRMMSDRESTSMISTSLRVARAIRPKKRTPSSARCCRSSLRSISAMLASSAAKSSSPARSQASRITTPLISRRASARLGADTRPRNTRSCSDCVSIAGLPSRMKAPPLTPFCSETTPEISRVRSASRTAGRLTLNSRARSRSAGSLSPGCSAPEARRLRICSQISSKTRRVFTCWKMSSWSPVCIRSCPLVIRQA